MLSRRAFVESVAAASLRAAPPRRPNVLLLVADQWRGQALPSAGDRDLIAPNLARLARDGVDFRRAYTSYPVCCPSRAAMLTGRYPHEVGVTRNHTQLPLSAPTMSETLKRAGYRTGYIGKWHLDGNENPGFVPPERRRGFDYWAAYNVQHRQYGSVYFRDTPEPIPIKGFEPDHLTDLALQFIGQQNEQPFFLYLSWVAPHPPFTPPARHAAYDPARLDIRANVSMASEMEARTNMAGYYGLCSAVDEDIGRLLAELHQRSLADDTIVMFTSDHGYTLGSHGLDAIDSPYEESVRIPLIVRYPRRLRPRVEEDRLMSNVDYAPMLLSMCGLPARPWSHRDAVFAEGSLESPEEWRMAIRGFDKLVVDARLAPTHLFDLLRDPYETQNLVAERTKRRTQEQLLALLRGWINSKQ
jgi:arylsulfatase A-like enzyme